MPLVDPRNENDQEGFNPNVDNSSIKAQSGIVGKVFVYISMILIIPIFWYISKRNTFNKRQMKINEVASGIDVQLKKRRDTLIKLVDATKSSMKYEKELLSDITKLRSSRGTSSDAKQDIANDLAQTNRIGGRIMATFEAYPNLKAEDNIAKLMDNAADIENEIAAARRLYNAEVNKFNSDLFVYPSSVVADSLRLVKLPLFAASVTDKQDVSLNLG